MSESVKRPDVGGARPFGIELLTHSNVTNERYCARYALALEEAIIGLHAVLKCDCGDNICPTCQARLDKAAAMISNIPAPQKESR